MSDMNEEVRSLVVASKVKEVIKDKGLQTAGEAIDALNKRVLAIVEEAVTRAQANKRATVKAQDF
jgi:histone H3/H4